MLISTSEPRTNCPSSYDAAIRIAPIRFTIAAMKMVQRRPSTSPMNVQARAPKIPKSVYRAMIVPEILLSPKPAVHWGRAYLV